MRKKIKSGPTQIVLIVGHCDAKPQKKKVTFSLRKKKSVENSKKRKLLNEGNSEIEQVIGKRQRKKTKRLIEEDYLDEEDVEKQCR